jgi:amino acid transporter
MTHPEGSASRQFDPQTSASYNYEYATTSQMVSGVATDVVTRDANGVPQPKLDASGKPVPFHISYPEKDSSGAFVSHPNAKSVIRMHNFGWMFVQATIAILILVGFESVTSMGGEAKNAKRDVPIAVITSLLVQGCFCYLFEYFAANYILNNGYTMTNAGGSAAPIGDLMILVGDTLFGAGNGRIFMLAEAATVFLALIGTTLSCMNTGARVTYAMGKDKELPDSMGLLHKENATPHRAIWLLAGISAIVGCITVVMFFGDGAAPADTAIQALPHGFWSSFGYTTHDKMAALPNSFLTMTLASNFGTFLLYMLSCVTCIVCFHKHPQYKFVRHLLIPIFGLLANLACMVFYVVGPFMGYGTKMEPLLALGVALCWAIYGGIYFLRASKATGRTTLVGTRASAA